MLLFYPEIRRIFRKLHKIRKMKVESQKYCCTPSLFRVKIELFLFR